ncbi:hypothetical protein HDE_05269 [Halotydeus destructor]|nr:hypothetical protein HDE_05269 [Halotydeus destructor]
MDVSFVLSSLDWYFLLIGTKLIRPRRAHRAIRLIILALTLIYGIYDTALNIRSGILSRSIFKSVRFFTRSVFPCLVQIILAMESDQLKQLLEDMLYDIKKQYVIKLRRICRSSVSIILLCSLVTLIMRIWTFNIGSDERVLKTLFVEDESILFYHRLIYYYLELIHIPLFEQQWIPVSGILYCIFVMAWYYNELSFTVNESNMADSRSRIQLIERKTALNSFKERINAKLSWLPFLWFTLMFLQTSGMILHLKDGGVGSINNRRRLVLTIMENASVFVVLMIVIKLESRIAKLSNKNVLQVLASDIPSSSHRERLIRLLEGRTEFDGMLFRLNRSLVLGFVGSLITFTVMFLQLQGM